MCCLSCDTYRRTGISFRCWIFTVGCACGLAHALSDTFWRRAQRRGSNEKRNIFRIPLHESHIQKQQLLHYFCNNNVLLGAASLSFFIVAPMKCLDNKATRSSPLLFFPFARALPSSHIWIRICLRVCAFTFVCVYLRVLSRDTKRKRAAEWENRTGRFVVRSAILVEPQLISECMYIHICYTHMIFAISLRQYTTTTSCCRCIADTCDAGNYLCEHTQILYTILSTFFYVIPRTDAAKDVVQCALVNGSIHIWKMNGMVKE